MLLHAQELETQQKPPPPPPPRSAIVCVLAGGLTCVSALVCFQVRALRVNLAAAVELAPVYSPPAVGRRVPADQSRLLCALPRAAAPDFTRRVHAGVRRHPAARHADGLGVGLRRGRRSADDGGAKRSRAAQDTQRVGGKAVRGRELLRTIGSFAAGVRIHAVAVQDRAVLIVLLRGRRQLGVGLDLGLVPASQNQLAPEVLLAVELELGRGDVRLALQIALQLQACLAPEGEEEEDEMQQEMKRRALHRTR